MKDFDRSALGGVGRDGVLQNEIALWRAFSGSPGAAVSRPDFIGAIGARNRPSVTRACERALGYTAIWVRDPRIRVVEVLEGADWFMMV
jgi:hypothetical protein